MFNGIKRILKESRNLFREKSDKLPENVVSNELPLLNNDMSNRVNRTHLFFIILFKDE